LKCFRGDIRGDTKDIYNVTKDYISNKCCSSELSINQGILKKSTQLFSTLIIIKNVFFFCALYLHRMISEGSCDTKDWSNDADRFLK